MQKLITEDQVERAVERQMDAADRAFMSGKIDQAAYDKLVKDIDAWATEQLRYAK